MPEELHWAKTYANHQGEKDGDKKLLEKLKNEDKLLPFALQLVVSEHNLDEAKKQAFHEFFKLSLSRAPDERAADLQELFDISIFDW